MSIPKRHHYVPKFYLERFTDSAGFLWVFDKQTDRVFQSRPVNLAAQGWFYEASELQGTETDPIFLESQFAGLETEAANITACWLQQVEIGDSITIPEVNRDIMSLYIVTQLFRTAEQRAILEQFVRAVDFYGVEQAPSEDNLKNLHVRLLCDDLIHQAVAALKCFIWVFAKNRSGVSFYTSDHPVMLKSPNNKNWIVTPRMFDKGVQVILPLSPSVIVYCKEPTYWHKLGRFNNAVSPVEFTRYMVQHENSGQVGMSTRFVFSDKNEFAFARLFCDEHPEIRDPMRDRIEVETLQQQ